VVISDDLSITGAMALSVCWTWNDQ